MTYQEADRLSQTNKEFIRALFPADSIYISLLPYAVQELIGQVGPETKGVEKMLRRIGFEYADRIDPFDGGPHFIAKTDDITLVKHTKTARAVALPDGDDGGPLGGLVSVERDRAPHFAATGSRFRLEGSDVGLPAATIKQLGLAARRHRRRPAVLMRVSRALAAAERRRHRRQVAPARRRCGRSGRR